MANLLVLMSGYFLSAIGAVYCFADNAPATTQTAPLAGQFGPHGNLEGFIAKGEWLYDWPQGKVPDTFTGMQIAETPVNNALPNLGRTMENWGRAIVVKANSGDATVHIWCEQQFVRTRFFAGPPDDWGSCFSTLEYRAIDFHGIPAAVAETKILDMHAANAKASPDLAQPHRIFLIIRPTPANLIRIESWGIPNDVARGAAADVAESIFKYMSIQARDNKNK